MNLNTPIEVGKTYHTHLPRTTVTIIAGPLKNNPYPWVGIIHDDDGTEESADFNDAGEIRGVNNDLNLALPQPVILLSDVKRILSQVRSKAHGFGNYCPLYLMDEAFKTAPVTYVEIPQ